MQKIILASASPRRRELMAMAGLSFDVLVSDCDENIAYDGPADMVQKLSLRKAQNVARKLTQAAEGQHTTPTQQAAVPQAAEGQHTTPTQQAAAPQAAAEQHLVIGADTIVYFQNQILGKPKDAEDAFHILTAMAGQTHTVYTGVTIIDTATSSTTTFYEATKVEFYDVTEDEIKAYIATGDPLDKAGSYGVQGRGAFLVRRIEGDYFTVVGLPIAHLIRELRKILPSGI